MLAVLAQLGQLARQPLDVLASNKRFGHDRRLSGPAAFALGDVGSLRLRLFHKPVNSRSPPRAQ